jgi:hypothetical protein
MARNERVDPRGNTHSAGGGQRAGSEQGGGQARQQPPRHAGSGQAGPKDAPPATPAAAGTRTPAGLDAARHAATQRTAENADILQRSYIPACMATALGMSQFDVHVCRDYLDRFVADAGGTQDPVERVLLEGIAFANLRLADLQSQAAQAKSIDAAKAYTSAAARLLGEIRRTALSLRVYRDRTPAEPQLRVAKVG